MDKIILVKKIADYRDGGSEEWEDDKERVWILDNRPNSPTRGLLFEEFTEEPYKGEWIIRNEVKTKKYYYAYSKCEAYGNVMDKPQCSAIDQHPFEWIAYLNTIKVGYYNYLISWQEITKEEFDLFNKLQDENKI